MRLIYSFICIYLGELINFSGSIYFVLLYWNKAEEMLRILALFCGFAMLFLLEKDGKAGKHFCGKLWDLLGSYFQDFKCPVVFHDISYWIGFAAANGDTSRERLWPCQWSRLEESVTEWERNVFNQIFLLFSFLLCFSLYIN